MINQSTTVRLKYYGSEICNCYLSAILYLRKISVMIGFECWCKFWMNFKLEVLDVYEFLKDISTNSFNIYIRMG